VFLDAKDPERRARRRAAAGTVRKKSAGNAGNSQSKPISGRRRRTISLAVRDAVFVRDGGRCAFESAGGRKCSSCEGLEIDHILPLAKGGSDEPQNLRLLCRAHNQHAAREAFGRDRVGPHRRGA
jgi:5-methylcytosine-specific restriction endonuclease McrA